MALLAEPLVLDDGRKVTFRGLHIDASDMAQAWKNGGISQNGYVCCVGCYMSKLHYYCFATCASKPRRSLAMTIIDFEDASKPINDSSCRRPRLMTPVGRPE